MTTLQQTLQEYHKIMREWIESQWKIESAQQAGEPYTRIMFEAEAHKVEEKLKSFLQSSIERAVRDERERIRKEIGNLSEVLDSDGKYVFSDKVYINKAEAIKVCG